jgi:23S rRNA pseudouridine1911/1915/1917 synthase
MMIGQSNESASRPQDGDSAAGLVDYIHPPGEGGETAEVRLAVERHEGGLRLDRFVAMRLPDVSRSRIQQWIALGAVEVEGAGRSAKHRLIGYESVTVIPQPRAAESAFAPDPVPLSVVHSDEHLLVIDKPPGLVTHPAAGNWRGTLMNGILHHWPDQAALPRAGIVHRLDKDTSGLLVVARSEMAIVRLVAQLADRSMSRRYLALVDGETPETGIIDAPIGRDPQSPIRMAVVNAHKGRNAVTQFKTIRRGRLGNGKSVSLVLCQLQTGRTHQIRVHLQHLGFPLIGDTVYRKSGVSFGVGDGVAGFGRQALHAWRLGLIHPADERPASWTAPIPADLFQLLDQCQIDASSISEPSA